MNFYLQDREGSLRGPRRYGHFSIYLPAMWDSLKYSFTIPIFNSSDKLSVFRYFSAII